MADITFTRDKPAVTFTKDQDPPSGGVTFTRDAPETPAQREIRSHREFNPTNAVLFPLLNFITAPVRGLAGDAYAAVTGFSSPEEFYGKREKVVGPTEFPEEGGIAGGISHVLGLPGRAIAWGAKKASDAVLGEDVTKKIAPVAVTAGDIVGSGLVKAAPRIAGSAALGTAAAREFIRSGDLPRSIRMTVSPMTEGSDAARGIAKDFANAERGATFMRGHFDDIFKGYKPDQRAVIWNTADQASVAAQRAHADILSKGGDEAAANAAAHEAGNSVLSSLPPKTRFELEQVQRYSEGVWEQARAIGMVEGAPLPFYMTRALVDIGEDGAASYVKPVEGKAGSPQGEGGLPLDAMGVNLRTTGTNARSHLTVEETEAAARERFGPNAMVLRDIRTLPMAVERMEKAIAGRKLINDVKNLSQAAGTEAVSEVDRSGFFTMDHPAFKTYAPRMRLRNETGRVEPLRDPEGNIVFDRKPIYVSKEFEGPLRAVLRHKGGPIYSALMDLKGKSMSVIMNSPLIHNMVEWGRALPMMPGKVVTGRIYFEGNAFRRNNLPGMQEAVSNGLVPIGHRGYVQDITGLAEEPTMRPGRSLTATILGKAGDLYSKGTGDAIRRGVDTAGDFWHNTLLWDRVADLQAGIYKNARDTFIKKGLDPQTASRTAAHLANRYAGALPHEAMSEMARKVGNFVLFSRSFTLGNVGALKDIIRGLPMDVQAQIERDAGTLMKDKATSLARRKALNAFMVDLALYYGANSVTQNAFDMLSRDQSLSDIEKGYVDRMTQLLHRTQEHPVDVLNPLDDLASLTPNADNEPGKENRILVGYDRDGTGIYMRLPVGKIGEEFQGWVSEPLTQFTRKEGTIMRPLIETVTNDKGFGRHLYDPDAKGVTANMRAAGNILWNFFQSGIPSLQLDAAGRVIRGEERPADVGKTVAPFFGLNISKGFPGGPAMGVIAAENRRRDDAVREQLPAINDAIRAGRTAEAVQQLQQLGVAPGLIRYYIKVATNPALRMSQRRLLDFYRSAKPEDIERFEKQMEMQH